MRAYSMKSTSTLRRCFSAQVFGSSTTSRAHQPHLATRRSLPALVLLTCATPCASRRARRKFAVDLRHHHRAPAAMTVPLKLPHDDRGRFAQRFFFVHADDVASPIL